MLGEKFTKVLRLASKQPMAWRLHQELLAKKRASTTAEGADHCCVMGNNWMLGRICSSVFSHQVSPDPNSDWCIHTCLFPQNAEEVNEHLVKKTFQHE